MRLDDFLEIYKKGGLVEDALFTIFNANGGQYKPSRKEQELKADAKEYFGKLDSSTFSKLSSEMQKAMATMSQEERYGYIAHITSYFSVLADTINPSEFISRARTIAGAEADEYVKGLEMRSSQVKKVIGEKSTTAGKILANALDFTNIFCGSIAAQVIQHFNLNKDKIISLRPISIQYPMNSDLENIFQMFNNRLTDKNIEDGLKFIHTRHDIKEYAEYLQESKRKPIEIATRYKELEKINKANKLSRSGPTFKSFYGWLKDSHLIDCEITYDTLYRNYK